MELKSLSENIKDKNNLISNLNNQIQNYQAECDLVINNQSQEDIGKQLKILINEINALRGKINDIVTFDQRISNFDEFIKIFNHSFMCIRKNRNGIVDKNRTDKFRIHIIPPDLI